jgi:hypothetical protein
MRRALTVSLLVAAGGVGCSFNGSRADQFRCHDGQCPAGLVCEQGLCVAGGGGGDGGADAATTTDAAGEAAAHDAAGDAPAAGDRAIQSDAPAPSDAPVQEDAPAQQDAPAGCSFDPLTSGPGQFSVVSGSWSFGATGYTQATNNDLHASWLNRTGGDAVSIDATVTITGQGNDNVTFLPPPQPAKRSVAGLLVRAAGLSATNVRSYLCGLDSRNGGRLLLLRIDSGTAVVNVLADQPITTFTQNLPQALHAEAAGPTITCTAGTVTATATDATIATGSVGFFTIGAVGRFRDATYCVP